MSSARLTSAWRLLAVAALCLGGTTAHAFQDAATGLYVEAGRTPGGSDTDLLSLGLVLPWPALTSPSGPWSFQTDLYLGQWRTRDRDGNHRNDTQLGAIATLRYRFDQGNSPWFAEAGLGATVLDHLYHSRERDFSTAFQFTEAAGIGRSFGSHGEHELSLRVQHFSNADIKRPNPGENFIRLRYVHRF